MSSEFAETAHFYPPSCVSRLLYRVFPDISQELLGQPQTSEGQFILPGMTLSEQETPCSCLPVFEVDRAGLCFELFSILSRV